MIAENRYTMTWELYREGARKITGKSYGRIARGAVFFLIAMWLALMEITYRRGETVLTAVMETAVLIAAAVWITVLLPRNRAKEAYHALETACGGNMDRSVRFYEDHLEAEAADGITELTYDQISGTLTTPRLLILLSREGGGIMLPHDGFTAGSEELALRQLEDAGD